MKHYSRQHIMWNGLDFLFIQFHCADFSKNQILKSKKKLFVPFLSTGFHCLKVTSHYEETVYFFEFLVLI